MTKSTVLAARTTDGDWLLFSPDTGTYLGTSSDPEAHIVTAACTPAVLEIVRSGFARLRDRRDDPEPFPGLAVAAAIALTRGR